MWYTDRRLHDNNRVKSVIGDRDASNDRVASSSWRTWRLSHLCAGGARGGAEAVRGVRRAGAGEYAALSRAAQGARVRALWRTVCLLRRDPAVVPVNRPHQRTGRGARDWGQPLPTDHQGRVSARLPRALHELQLGAPFHRRSYLSARWRASPCSGAPIPRQCGQDAVQERALVHRREHHPLVERAPSMPNLHQCLGPSLEGEGTAQTDGGTTEERDSDGRVCGGPPVYRGEHGVARVGRVSVPNVLECPQPARVCREASATEGGDRRLLTSVRHVCFRRPRLG
jgi:hypothetical protein